MQLSLRGLASIVILFAAMLVQAQPSSYVPDPQCDTINHVDIIVVPNLSNQLEIYLRPSMDYDGWFAAIVFTVKTFADDNVVFGSVVSQTPYMSIGTYGTPSVNDIYRYQQFGGESATPLYAVGEAWTAGEEVLLAKINILSGTSSYQIAVDQYSWDSNGIYYISLGGYNCFGIVESGSVEVRPVTIAAGDVVVAPNPTNGPVYVTTSFETSGPVSLELFDASGRMVMQRTFIANAGQGTESLDLQGSAEGIYTLRVSHADRISTHKVVLNGSR
jgi:hypothetical protein